MSIVRVIGVWIAAVVIAVVASGAWIGLQHMDDALPLSKGALLREALPVLGVMALCQVGLVLAPVAGAWRWPYRVVVGLLMAPTLLATLAVGYQQLGEAAFWGSVAFWRVDSIWVPVLLLYVVQPGGLVRGRPTLEVPDARGLTIPEADKAPLS